MPTLTGVFDLLASRGLDLAALGGAYVALLATVALAAAAFASLRRWLLISPNRSARDYAIYVSVVLATLAIATVLENESLPPGSATLQYAALPQLLLLMALHLWIWYRQEPWVVALGAAAASASITVAAVAGFTMDLLRPAHWVAAAVLALLLGVLWRKSVSTKRGFIKASSIYLASKETLDATMAPQRPWLGLVQWVALAGASLALAVGNALLRGSGIEQIPAVGVALESLLLIGVTGLVCAVPAASYWLARKTWMPELTRFVWLVWIVVSFAFTYGNFLDTLNRA
jgi:hypothetical protein